MKRIVYLIQEERRSSTMSNISTLSPEEKINNLMTIDEVASYLRVKKRTVYD